MHQQYRIVEPMAVGTRKTASRINSKDSSISKISKMIGKGTFSLEANIVKSKLVGKISW